MPVINVYHNPHFLDYRGDHTVIVPPVRPVATVEVPAEMPVEQALEAAFRKTQHVSESWWNYPGVMLQVRSTSVGDLMADAEGNLFVVESAGFRPFQPQTIRPLHQLAEAYQQLDSALVRRDTGRIVQVAGRVRNLILHILEAEGYQDGQSVGQSEDTSQFGNPESPDRREEP